MKDLPVNSQVIKVALNDHSFSLATKIRFQPESETTIVFLHGLGCAKESFDAAFSSESLKKFSILTFDFLGFGESDKPDDFSYSLEDQAAITVGLIKQLSPNKVVLVAHSMGGTIGLLVAQQLDNLVDFINVEGNLVSQDSGIVSRQTAEQGEAAFIENGFDAFLKGLVDSGRKDFAAWAKWYENSSRIAVYRSSKSLVEWSDSGKLMDIFNTLPNKLYIYGDEESKDYLLDQFKGVQSSCIPESGHFMMLDKPEVFYSVISEYVETTPYQQPKDNGTTRHLITSALPYVNGVKHLGNLVGSMLPADVYARYLRQRGNDVLFICATDEHGTPAELGAKEAGLPVEIYCEQQHEIQRSIYEKFGLSFDHFGRSSSTQNAEITQRIARSLNDNGFIEQRTVKQVYSVADGRFLPDRYIVGTCPNCGYDKARGDQCENCTRVLDPTDLIDPRSAISGSTTLEVRETKHLFLLQSKLQGDVEQWLNDVGSSTWPTLASSIAKKWLKEGLHDRAITRDLEWGVPVPNDTWPELAAEGKVFYVWFDAPIEYIGATKEWSDLAPLERDWKSWWYATDNVYYTEFMAKDNVPFHTVMFPATLLGTREPWKKVDYVKAFNWLNYYGGKFSTSQKRGIFTDVALDVLPADYWRYFLIANAPESGDTSFTWELLSSVINKDLAGTLGNFVNRVLSFSLAQFGDTIPEGGIAGEQEERLGKEIARLVADYEGHLDGLEFRKAAQSLRMIWSAGNSYLEQKAPWLEVRNDPEAAALTLRTAMNLIHLYALVSEPIIPGTARQLRDVFEIPQDNPDIDISWPIADKLTNLSWLPIATKFKVPEVLFHRIIEEDVKGWGTRFGDS